MSASLGIELGADTVRGVRLEERWPLRPRTRMVEIARDGESPEQIVATVREQLGPARRIALAIDLPLLFITHPRLPAVADDAKRDILRLAPERFFPVRAAAVVPAVYGDDGPVFATLEEPLLDWIARLGRLGAVEVIEPGPVALARALAGTTLATAVVALDRRDDGIGLVEIRDGRVRAARRVFGGIDGAAAALRATGAIPATLYLSPWSEDRARALAALLPETTVQPLPAVSHVDAPFLGAFGVALALHTRPAFTRTLVPPELAGRIASADRRRRWLAAAACVAALGFALTSLDARRERATRELTAAVAALRERAAPALALQAERDASAQRTRAIRQIAAERADPLAVLAALSDALPRGAYLRGLRLAGGQWQIDGYAPNASSLVAQLGQVRRFQDVRFLSATNRVALGEQTYESFALAFRYVAAP